MLRQKALKLYKDFKQGIPYTTAKPFTANKRWLYRFRNKNIKITGEAASADKAAAAILQWS